MNLKDQYDRLSREELVQLLCERRPEGVDLVFAGKATVRDLAKRVRPRAFKGVASLNTGQPDEQANNVVVEGDNLIGMVSLYKYHGTVDLVLADPPFNTGNDFRYNDKWDTDPNDPDPGQLVGTEDGARYTKWMKFMLPRLQLMKAMLKPSGVVAVCIDHRELFRLGLLMNEVFGEANRLGIINWQRTYSPKNNVTTHLSHSTEYVLIYAKDTDQARTTLLPRSESMNSKYKNPDNDLEGAWRYSDISGPGASTHRGQVYAIQNPLTGVPVYPPEGRCWAASRERMKARAEGWGCTYIGKDLDDKCVPALMINGSLKQARAAAKKKLKEGNWPDLVWAEDGTGAPALKKHLSRVKQGVVPMTFWGDEEYEEPLVIDAVSWPHGESGHSQQGINELSAIVGKSGSFQTVKPLKLFKKIVQLWCPPNGRVLDTFAGSGTTGHAVLELNKETGSNRRFILIEQGRADREDHYARTLLAKRLRRVIKGDWAAGKRTPLGGGFRFLTLTEKVDAKAVLAMEREDLIDLLLSTHWDADSRERPSLIRVDAGSSQLLIARDELGTGYFLVWKGASAESSLDVDVHDRIVKEAKAHGIRPPYFVYARYEDYQVDDVRFFKIPDTVLRNVGVNEARDRYNEQTP